MSLAAVAPDVESVAAAAAALRGVVSHQSAARLWGIDLVRAASAPHVTVARNRSRVSRPGVVLHRSDLAAAEVAVREGVALTTPRRTVLDLARSLPPGEAVAAVDSALRGGLVSLPELVSAAAGLPPGIGRPRCRAAIALADPVCGSVLETLCRLALLEAGLCPFETQYPIRTRGGAVVRVDFAWPQARVVVETDGFAFHADRARYRSDRRRSNALVLAGWRVLRFSWEDVVHGPEAVAAQVRRALGG